ncbi:MAG: tRNA (adenosine(37)-N6)-dimethylallyltransferase MiaA [Bacteroidota bacterium]
MLITILGPTACGKTQLAVALAHQIHGEIISADSRQVYRRMSIGTGKDLMDFHIQGTHIPYHLIDIANPGDEYNLFRFTNDFKNAYRDITSRQLTPILCGGTGMYIEAVLRNFAVPDVAQNHEFRKTLENRTDDELKAMLLQHKTLHNETDTENRRRLIRALEIAHFSAEKTIASQPLLQSPHIIFGIQLPRAEVRNSITLRLQTRLKQGMIDEVRELLDSGVSPSRLIRYGLEYKYITEYLLNQYSFDEMVRLLNIAIHQFSKRQMTWFRGMQRRGLTIHWLDGLLPMNEKLNCIQTMLSTAHNSK